MTRADNQTKLWFLPENISGLSFEGQSQKFFDQYSVLSLDSCLISIKECECENNWIELDSLLGTSNLLGVSRWLRSFVLKWVKQDTLCQPGNYPVICHPPFPPSSTGRSYDAGQDPAIKKPHNKEEWRNREHTHSIHKWASVLWGCFITIKASIVMEEGFICALLPRIFYKYPCYTVI